MYFSDTAAAAERRREVGVGWFHRFHFKHQKQDTSLQIHSNLFKSIHLLQHMVATSWLPLLQLIKTIDFATVNKNNWLATEYDRENNTPCGHNWFTPLHWLLWWNIIKMFLIKMNIYLLLNFCIKWWWWDVIWFEICFILFVIIFLVGLQQISIPALITWTRTNWTSSGSMNHDIFSMKWYWYIPYLDINSVVQVWLIHSSYKDGV